MRSFNLIKNPELFQGQDKLNNKKQYFEGWYFKHSKDGFGISFIPGIHVENARAFAFIQVITNEKSYYIKYDIKDFYYSIDPFFVKIGSNVFSKSGVKIRIKDEEQKLEINGEIEYRDNIEIERTGYAPNIMGPFSFIPFMECNHAILSMYNEISGKLNINGEDVIFNKNHGYIEKDWGSSFPSNYIWCQANNFEKDKACFFLSVADIPFNIFTFQGVICVLILNGKEYRFATYHNCSVSKISVKEKEVQVQLKQGKYILEMICTQEGNLPLKAPVNGKMSKTVKETILASVSIKLKVNGRVIFSDESKQAGLEVSM